MNNRVIAVGELSMLSDFSGEERELPWQQILGQNKQKIAVISLLYKIWRNFIMCSRFSASAKSNMLSELSREQRELRWQPNLGKIRQDCTDFSSAQDLETFFA